MTTNGKYTGHEKFKKINFKGCSGFFSSSIFTLYQSIDIQAQGGEDGHWPSLGFSANCSPPPRLGCKSARHLFHTSPLQVPPCCCLAHPRHLPAPCLRRQLRPPTGRTPPRHIHLLQQVSPSLRAMSEKKNFSKMMSSVLNSSWPSF